MEELRALLRSNIDLRISLDVDEVIAAAHRIVIEDHLNKVKGTSFTIQDHTDYTYSALGSNYEEMMGFYSLVWKTQHRQIEFIGNTVKLQKLAEYFPIEIVTIRNPNEDGIGGGTVPKLIEWVEMHGLGNFRLVVCDPENPKQADKAKLDYHIYIDDSPALALSILNSEGKFLFFVKRPWNTSEQEIVAASKTEKIRLVENVNEATDILLAEIKKHGSKLRAA